MGWIKSKECQKRADAFIPLLIEELKSRGREVEFSRIGRDKDERLQVDGIDAGVSISETHHGGHGWGVSHTGKLSISYNKPEFDTYSYVKKKARPEPKLGFKPKVIADEVEKFVDWFKIEEVKKQNSKDAIQRLGDELGSWTVCQSPGIRVSSIPGSDLLELEIRGRLTERQAKRLIAAAMLVATQECICHETTVGKSECPVHGPHPAVAKSADRL